METILPILGLATLGSVAGLGGGLLLLWSQNFAKKISLHLISFAAGVILSVAFLDLLPEAISLGGEKAFTLALLGLVLFFFLEDFVLHFHHHEKHQHQYKLSSVVPLIIVGDSVHNFIDGIVIAASFLTDVRLGLVVAIATFFHEIPQEIGDFGVLLEAGLSRAKVVLANLLSAGTTYLGAAVTLLFVENSKNLLGPLLGLAAGMFLYIAVADILPELVRGRNARFSSAALFLTGIALIFFLTRLVPD